LDTHWFKSKSLKRQKRRGITEGQVINDVMLLSAQAYQKICDD
jgi:hypothetical protein